MSVQLYTKGTSHTVNGIRCSLVNVNNDIEMNALLEKGYVFDPKELKATKPESKKGAKKDTKKE
jgi:hypothetical protein